jgi:glucose-fructose oxidoreductase
MSFAGHEDFGAARLVQAAAGYRQNNEDHWKLRKKMGGGAMYDMGVYPLQGARYSIGEEPVAVMAQHQILRPALFTEVDEVTSFQLEFPGGAMAQCTTSFGYGGVNSLEVIYEKGKARLEPFSSYRNVQGTASGDRTLEPWPGNQQARQMDDDALAIMNDTPLLVPGEEGLRDIRVVEAVYASAKKGKRIRI